MATFFPPLTREHVIYEDSDLVAVFKPAGLPSMPTREQQRYDLRTCAEAVFGKPIHFPSRLDTAVCGIVLGSQAKRSHKAVQHAFEYRAIRKEYLAEVAQRPSWRWISCCARIDRTREHPVLRQIAQSGQDARSTFRVLKKKQTDGCALVEAHPFTGRTHQLRIHLSYLGAPVVGDPFYGPMESAPLDSRAPLHLMAYRLQFTHPRTQARMNLVVPDRLIPEWVKKYGIGLGPPVACPS